MFDSTLPEVRIDGTALPTKEFFRQMPNVLLGRYFQGRGLFDDLDFAAMKVGKPDELFGAWMYLQEGQRNEMDAECRDIFEMSCEKGFRAIVDEAEFQLDEEEHKGAITEGHCAASLCHDTTTMPDYHRVWHPGGTYFLRCHKLQRHGNDV